MALPIGGEEEVSWYPGEPKVAWEAELPGDAVTISRSHLLPLLPPELCCIPISAMISNGAGAHGWLWGCGSDKLPCQWGLGDTAEQ